MLAGGKSVRRQRSSGAETAVLADESFAGFGAVGAALGDSTIGEVAVQPEMTPAQIRAISNPSPQLRRNTFDAPET
jgi:hypothetical protein